MIFSAIFKAVLFYIVFVSIRSVLRSMAAGKSNTHNENKGRPGHRSEDIVEAEYRIID